MPLKSTIKDAIMLNNLKRVSQGYRQVGIHEMTKELGIDLSKQYTIKHELDDYWRTKIETEQAFQIGFTIKAIQYLENKGIISHDEQLTLVDIGDSAGNHLKYLKQKLKASFKNIDAVSVNLDPVAVEKIMRGGGTAVLCRAEEYSADVPVSLYLTYEMCEHLHNPALFFRQMALADNGQYMVMTVPYVKRSRVSCSYINDGRTEPVYAEGVHIFELSVEDWQRIAYHSGWKTIDSDIYYQYPRNSLLTPLYRWLWRRSDFEGFLGLFLERDMTQADRYQDWE